MFYNKVIQNQLGNDEIKHYYYTSHEINHKLKQKRFPDDDDNLNDLLRYVLVDMVGKMIQKADNFIISTRYR